MLLLALFTLFPLFCSRRNQLAPPPFFSVSSLLSLFSFPFTMAESRNVRDVPAEEFIKAYAAHLRSNDKVNFSSRGSSDRRRRRRRRRRQPSSLPDESKPERALRALLCSAVSSADSPHRDRLCVRVMRRVELRRPLSRSLALESARGSLLLDRASLSRAFGERQGRREGFPSHRQPCSRPMNGPDRASSSAEASACPRARWRRADDGPFRGRVFVVGRRSKKRCLSSSSPPLWIS